MDFQHLATTVLASMASGLIAGAITSWAHLKALDVHITYLRAAVERHERLLEVKAHV